MQAPEKTSAAIEKAFESLLNAAAPKKLGVVEGAMFGMRCLKVNSKAFAGIFGDSLVFKLPGEMHARALALKGAVLFDPSGKGRPMKEWVVVPKKHAAEFDALAAAACEYVNG